MKLTKKVLAFSLSLAMASAMGVTTFADDGVATGATTTTGTYSITINNAMGTYQAYQVFQGDLSSDGKLSNVAWGRDIDSFTYSGKTDAADIAKELESLTDDSKGAQEFAALAALHVQGKSASGQATAGNGVATISNLAPGYYVILNSVTGEGEAVSRYILQVTKNQKIENKAEVPTFEKKIKDKNDTQDTITEWQDSADYDIGDSIPFKLEGTVANNYTDYKSDYKFVFHDVEETGLQFKSDSVQVYLDDNIINTGYTINTSPDDGCTFEITFPRLQDIADVNNGSKIRIEYESVLTEDAKLGDVGNLNKAKLEYSNNPNSAKGGETGKTPWDNVIVFTYKVVINKVDGEQYPLAGAEFKLFKKVTKDGDFDEVEVSGLTLNKERTSFTFKGLDDGNYILRETKTPEGYNSISDIEFSVDANHTITWDGTKRESVLEELNGKKVTGEITLTADKSEGSLSADVVNKAGSLLPSTGGIGTTIFYVVGVVLMLGAGVLLITKRRMNTKH